MKVNRKIHKPKENKINMKLKFLKFEPWLI